MNKYIKEINFGFRNWGGVYGEVLEEGWVRELGRNGRMGIILGGGSFEYKGMVMENVFCIW